MKSISSNEETLSPVTVHNDSSPKLLSAIIEQFPPTMATGSFRFPKFPTHIALAPSGSYLKFLKRNKKHLSLILIKIYLKKNRWIHVHLCRLLFVILYSYSSIRSKREKIYFDCYLLRRNHINFVAYYKVWRILFSSIQN